MKVYKFSKSEVKVFSHLELIDRWSIVGAKALSYHGVHRYTGDTDILCHSEVAMDVLLVMKERGFSIHAMDVSHARCIKGNTEFDVLITSAPEYSNALQRAEGSYYTTCSGLLDMYLLSDKAQNQYDAVRLLQVNNCRPSEEVLSLEYDRFNYYLEKSKEDIKLFKPRLLCQEFDLEALLLELDGIE